ncbi:MAG TPA: hypothetical protein VEN82_07275 [Actinomycetota bacterium]|nr:hypothetical protein [Actinomycetota bacterium]
MRLRDRLQGLAVTPFEAAFGFLIFVSGLVSLLGIGFRDPLTAVLPDWLAAAFGWVFLASGLIVTVGLLRRSFRIEGAGLALLEAVLVVRLLVYFDRFGFHADAITTAATYLVFLWACAVRFGTLRRGQTLVRTRIQEPP